MKINGLSGTALLIEGCSEQTERAPTLTSSPFEEAESRKANILVRTVERIAGIGGWEWDVARDVMVWSEEVYRILGRDPQELPATGRNFVACIHPDDRRLVRDAAAATLTRKKPFEVEFRILRPDGVERIVNSRAEFTVNRGGGVASLIGTLFDITDRKQAEEDLRTSEERFRLLVDSARDAILLYDSGEDRFVSANPAAEQLFGCPQEEILAHEAAHFLISEQNDGFPVAPAYYAQVRRALQGQREICERRIRTAAVQERLCELSLVRLPAGDGRLLRASFVDITERRKNEIRVSRLNRALRTLSRGNIVVVHSVTETELLDEMCGAIVEDGGYLLACIGMVRHDEAKTVKIVAHKGDRGRRYIEQLNLSWGEVPAGRGIAGCAVRSGEAEICQYLVADSTMAPWAELAADVGIGSAAAFPLRNSSGVFAVLLIYASEPNAFDSDELKLLRELAGDLAYGINTLRHVKESAELEQRWRSSLETTVLAIANTVEMRDPYTAGHQQRVARLAVAIARMLGVSDYDCQGIHLAGIIHDVGKVNIPAEILNKPGTLSRIESALIQEHAEAGFNIIKGIDFPWPIAQMVRQHHERLDGSGYPMGLNGDQILIESRILAVADTVDAMMSHRPYRAALGPAAALNEIEKNKGRLYDEAAVDACIALFREEGFSFDVENRFSESRD